jgi:hypothetical protein
LAISQCRARIAFGAVSPGNLFSYNSSTSLTSYRSRLGLVFSKRTRLPICHELGGISATPTDLRRCQCGEVACLTAGHWPLGFAGRCIVKDLPTRRGLLRAVVPVAEVNAFERQRDLSLLRRPRADGSA